MSVPEGTLRTSKDIKGHHHSCLEQSGGTGDLVRAVVGVGERVSVHVEQKDMPEERASLMRHCTLSEV